MPVTWYAFPKRMSVEAALVAYMEAMRVKGGSYARWSTGRARAAVVLHEPSGNVCGTTNLAERRNNLLDGAVCRKDFSE